jgi:hypothetical protein
MLISSSEETDQREPPVETSHSRMLRNSDRIQIRFGSYDIDIIENDDHIRVSKLYSLHNGKKTNRTFAIVAYPDLIEPAFKKEHEAIINGQSIGVVFEQNGWVIDKQHRYFGEIEIPSEHPGASSLFSGIGSTNPAIHIYSLVVNKDNATFEYALIAEIHHPEFLRSEDLEAIYGHGPNSDLTENTSVSDFLEIVRTKIQAL